MSDFRGPEMAYAEYEARLKAKDKIIEDFTEKFRLLGIAHGEKIAELESANKFLRENKDADDALLEEDSPEIREQIRQARKEYQEDKGIPFEPEDEQIEGGESDGGTIGEHQ